jgi:glucosyl-dolichyl phosphate glucuronosyltransferase
MLLTIAICTWNRSEWLRRTLRQMTRLVVPSDVQLEILVVNNNCTDSTDLVIAAFAQELPLRRLFQATPGLSKARNLAVRVASGDYIIWTDDDVLVDELWIDAYYMAFLQHPGASLFGGPIEPLFAVPPPEWLLKTLNEFGGALALRDLGPDPVRLERWKEPFGANMAFRAEALAQHPFDPALGPSAGRTTSALAGEETAVIHAMLDDGLEGWWVPHARVRHYVSPERMTTTYLRSKTIGCGKYVSRARSSKNPSQPRILVASLLGKALGAELRYRFHRAFSSPEVWARDLSESGELWGEFLGCLPAGCHSSR